jgi:hypothetical protein
VVKDYYKKSMDVYLRLPTELRAKIETMAFRHRLGRREHLQDAVQWLASFRDHLSMFQVELQIAINRSVWKTYHFSSNNAVQRCLIVDDPLYCNGRFFYTHSCTLPVVGCRRKEAFVGVHSKGKWLVFSVKNVN